MALSFVLFFWVMGRWKNPVHKTI